MLRVLLLLLLTFSSVQAWAFNYTIELTQADIQQKVAKMMPIERQELFFKVKVSNPEVNLSLNSNEMSMAVDLAASVPGTGSVQGKADISGALRYDNQTGAFYLVDPKLTELQIANMDQKVLPMVQDLAQLVIASVLPQQPVYKLKDDDLKQKLARAMLQSVEVKEGKLVLNMKAFGA